MTDLSADELAGVVDLFGALTAAELERAVDELAFKEGRDVDADAVADAVDDAVAAYALVRYEREDETLFVPGPAAFPTLPEHAEDLPHILDVPERDVDRAAVARALDARLRADVDRALGVGGTAAEADDAELRRLLDVTYDVAVWSDAVDVDDVRERLDEALGERE
ncbi:MAG: hypothetical protein ABEK02_09740 [Haloquadratum sp.]